MSRPGTIASRQPATDPPASPAGTGRTSVFVDANAPYDNLGDAVIVRQLLRLFRERASEVRVDARGMDPALRDVIETGDNGGNVASFLVAAAKDRMKRNGSQPRRILVLKPGHIGGRYSWSAWLSRLALLIATIAARAVKVEVIRVGFSVGDLAPNLLRLEVMQTRFMTAYAPRDRGSIAYAQSNRMRVTGRSTDLAFSLPVIERSGPVDIDLCLSFRSSLVGRSGPGEYHDRVQELAAGLLELAQKAGQSVVWAAQVSSDLPVARRALSRYPGIEAICFDGGSASAEELFATYSRAGVIVSNRLHSVLLAMAQGAPALAVTDLAAHNKITDLLTDVGLGEALVDIAEGPEAVWHRAQALAANPVPFMRTVRRVFAEQSALLTETLDDLQW